MEKRQLRVDKLTKYYDNKEVVKGISFDELSES